MTMPAYTRIPTLEETLLQVQSNAYLTAVLQLAHAHRLSGYGGVDCMDEMVAGEIYEDEEMNSPQLYLLGYIQDMPLDDKHAVVPYLRRLGYSVSVFHDFDESCPFSINFPGHAPTPKFRTTFKVAHTFLYATSPSMMRLRGVLFCVSRLIAWKHRALKYFQGSLATLRAEAVAEYEAMLE